MRPTFLVANSELTSMFRRKNRDIVSLGEDILWLEWKLISTVFNMENLFSSSIPILMQELHAYNLESCLLSMRSKPNLSLALTRMACELSRDIILMATNAAAQKLWQDRESRSKEYNKEFRFDRIRSNDSGGLFQIYKIGSRFGVHGHVTFLKDIGETSISYDGLLHYKIDENYIRTAYLLSLHTVKIFCTEFLIFNQDSIKIKSNNINIETIRSIIEQISGTEIPPIPEKDKCNVSRTS